MMQADVPRLETERLVLRGPMRSDFEAYAEIMASPRAEMMFGQLDRDAAWGVFASDMVGWLLDGFGVWTVTAKDGETPLAFVGASQPPSFPEPEFGWMTTAGAEGKGYVTEAARVGTAWLRVQGLPTLVSYLDPKNTRSIAVAERLGAVRDQETKGASDGDIVYRHWGQRP